MFHCNVCDLHTFLIFFPLQCTGHGNEARHRLAASTCRSLGGAQQPWPADSEPCRQGRPRVADDRLKVGGAERTPTVLHSVGTGVSSECRLLEGEGMSTLRYTFPLQTPQQAEEPALEAHKLDDGNTLALHVLGIIYMKRFIYARAREV